MAGLSHMQWLRHFVRDILNAQERAFRGPPKPPDEPPQYPMGVPWRYVPPESDQPELRLEPGQKFEVFEPEEQRLRRIIREELVAHDDRKESKRLAMRRMMGPG